MNTVVDCYRCLACGFTTKDAELSKSHVCSREPLFSKEAFVFKGVDG